MQADRLAVLVTALCAACGCGVSHRADDDAGPNPTCDASAELMTAGAIGCIVRDVRGGARSSCSGAPPGRPLTILLPVEARVNVTVDYLGSEGCAPGACTVAVAVTTPDSCDCEPSAAGVRETPSGDEAVGFFFASAPAEARSISLTLGDPSARFRISACSRE